MCAIAVQHAICKATLPLPPLNRSNRCQACTAATQCRATWYMKAALSLMGCHALCFSTLEGAWACQHAVLHCASRPDILGRCQALPHPGIDVAAAELSLLCSLMPWQLTSRPSGHSMFDASKWYTSRRIQQLCCETLKALTQTICQLLAAAFSRSVAPADGAELTDAGS